MPGEILICATAIMACGMRAALLALMPELAIQLYSSEIATDIEAFARFASALRPELTIIDADHVAVREVLDALGKRALASFNGQPGGQGMLGKIVVLTTRPDGEVLFSLAKHGARAYVSGCLPTVDFAQLVQTLLMDDTLYLLDSRTFADPQLAALTARQCLQPERMVDRWQEVEPPALEEDAEKPLLTDLELRLLRGLSCGMSTHVAARHAGISYWYAKGLIPGLTQKLQAKNRTGAVVQAWQLGLIDLPETEMIMHYAGTSSRQTGIADEQASGLEQRQVAISY